MNSIKGGTWIFIFVVLVSELESRTVEINKRDVSEFFKREKCIPELGCFYAGPPFFHILERPISLLPDDRDVINTHFKLFTRERHASPGIHKNQNLTVEGLKKNGFNPHIKTTIIVPGFMSHLDPKWKLPLKDALLRYEECNVFLVDWTGGDGTLYEQAVANTRVVGAEIALFIKQLQEKTGITPKSIHVIGHSLGAHVAGYAGKNVTGIGRITGLDPAGPDFTNMEAVVRLDRSDALFVDVIHTNAAPSRFQGFGLPESIGHFDFFPNGGHIQTGCPDVGHGILAFLKHPTLDADGLQDLMCSHERSIQLFISSMNNGGCSSVQCQNLELYEDGRCGRCSRGTSTSSCVPLGMQAADFQDRIDNHDSLNFFLNTTDKDPYCIN